MGYADRTVAETRHLTAGAPRLSFAPTASTTAVAARVRWPRPQPTRAVPLEQIEAELARLSPDAPREAPTETNALIGHILARYHDTHRRELPELLRLAARVGAAPCRPRHGAGRSAAPRWQELASALDEHMAKEEQILFPLMMQGGHPMIASPIGRMRFEHDEHGERLARLEELTHGLALPEDACPTWRALYAGLRKLIDDVHEHVHLENNLLFPRFS